MSDEAAVIRMAGRTYARDGAITLVVARAVISPGCAGAEEANIGPNKFEVWGPMKGSPGMGESEWSRCGLMKHLRPELDPASAIDYG